MTACAANLGRILCIDYSEQNERGQIIKHGCFGYREQTKDFEPDESIILAEFWQFLRGFDTYNDLIIGYNILDFDLPFIVQRSIIKNVRPTVDFYFGKYKNAPIFDTMRVWDCWKWGGATSLKNSLSRSVWKIRKQTTLTARKFTTHISKADSRKSTNTVCAT